MPHADQPAAPPFSLRRIAVPAFGPAVLFGLGEGAVTPLLPLTAHRLGASTAMVAFLLTLFTVGTLVSSMPASALTVRVGERRSILLAAVLGLLAVAALALAPSLLVFTVALVAYGASFAVFSLARMTWLVEAVPPERRGRALSTLGGAGRIGMFAGPFLGAGVIALAGVRAAYGVALAGLVLCALIALLMPDPADAAAGIGRRPQRPGEQAGLTGRAQERAPASPATPAGEAHVPAHGPGLWAVIRAHRRALVIGGGTIMLCSAVRMARQVVLPLWGGHAGLDPAATSAVFGLAALVDMLVFYPAGAIMDRWGRRWVTVPSMTILGGGLLLLATAHTLPVLALAAMIIGLGNGIGAGMVMTLGADLSPAAGRTRFLAAWRTMGDLGSVLGPALVAGVTAGASLGTAVAASGGLGLAAALAFALAVPRLSSGQAPGHP